MLKVVYIHHGEQKTFVGTASEWEKHKEDHFFMLPIPVLSKEELCIHTAMNTRREEDF